VESQNKILINDADIPQEMSDTHLIY